MDDLKLIKKHYGEKMMHLCRELFLTILETPGLLYETLTKKFNPSRLLYEDIARDCLYDEFKAIIYHEIYDEKEERKKVDKTPAELLDEAGYILYECKTEEDIQAFKKYYAAKEELCTFKGGRLNRCHVFFAVKKNADKIKRENFPYPAREDEYGTSVISIQFSRGLVNTLSIKNRYNHTVRNPDSTFSNNLDNIIPGLTESFESTYGLNINGNAEIQDIPGYVLAEDGKYYKYNFEVNNIYYCPDNIIIDNFRVKKFDKSRYLIIESFVIDLQEKTIRDYDSDHYESFTKSIPEIEDIKILNLDGGDKKIIINGDIEITINKGNQIKVYKNPQITTTGNYFLYESSAIEEIDLPNVEKIGLTFLHDAVNLKKINIPNCKEIRQYFLLKNKTLTEIDLPNVEKIFGWFMKENCVLERINIPKCKEIGEGFLSENEKLKSLTLPSVEEIKKGFLDDYGFLEENIDVEIIRGNKTYY